MIAIFSVLYLAYMSVTRPKLVIGPGAVNAALRCPHCQVTGKVHAKVTEQAQGVSGGKATGAILTGGVSLLATGLSRTATVTVLHCDNCSLTWNA